MYSVQRFICELDNHLFFCFSWVKKNVKETYGGDEEVRDLIFIFLFLGGGYKFLNFYFTSNKQKVSK